MTVFDGFWYGIGFVLGATLALAVVTIGWRAFLRDSTDQPEGPRSGLIVLRDYGSGRDYLMSPTGSLTPRLPPVEGGVDGR